MQFLFYLLKKLTWSAHPLSSVQWDGLWRMVTQLLPCKWGPFLHHGRATKKMDPDHWMICGTNLSCPLDLSSLVCYVTINKIVSYLSILGIPLAKETQPYTKHYRQYHKTLAFFYGFSVELFKYPRAVTFPLLALPLWVHRHVGTHAEIQTNLHVCQL